MCFSGLGLDVSTQVQPIKKHDGAIPAPGSFPASQTVASVSGDCNL